MLLDLRGQGGGRREGIQLREGRRKGEGGDWYGSVGREGGRQAGREEGKEEGGREVRREGEREGRISMLG